MPVTVRVSVRQFDALYAKAQRERSTVSDVLRRSLSYTKLDSDESEDR